MSRLGSSDIITLEAAEAITALQAVVIDANGKASLANGASGQRVDGIAQRSASIGDVVEVVIFGRTKALAGTRLTAGLTLSDGRVDPLILIPWTNAGGTEYSVARVISTRTRPPTPTAMRSRSSSPAQPVRRSANSWLVLAIAIFIRSTRSSPASSRGCPERLQLIADRVMGARRHPRAERDSPR